MNKFIYIMVCVVSLLVSQAVNATILTPAAIINNDFGEPFGRPSENMINQSVISTPYISGVTDFTSYVASNPTAGCNNCGGQYFGSGVSGNIDFDLGDIYNVNKLGLWNNGFRGITQLEIFTSNDSSFIGATSVGIFSPIVNGDVNADEFIQVLDLFDTNAQFVRFSIVAHATDILGISELIFDVSPAVVPVPPAIWLLLSGLSGLVGFSKFGRKVKAQ